MKTEITKPILICTLEEKGIQICGMTGQELKDSDPDILNIEETYIYFRKIETDKEKRIVYLNPDEEIHREQIEKILLSFFQEDFENRFEELESCWENFGNYCIAYRGGSGYVYTIWQFKDDDIFDNHSITK